jgi:hypothetical protein
MRREFGELMDPRHPKAALGLDGIGIARPYSEVWRRQSYGSSLARADVMRGECCQTWLTIYTILHHD